METLLMGDKAYYKEQRESTDIKAVKASSF